MNDVIFEKIYNLYQFIIETDNIHGQCRQISCV